MSKNSKFPLFSLLYKPEEAWKGLSTRGKGHLPYIYCCLALSMLSHFIHFLLFDSQQDWRMAIFAAILTFFIMGFGLICSTIFIRFLYEKLEKVPLSYTKALAYTAYSSILIFVFSIVGPFIPMIFQIIVPCTVYILFLGSEIFLEISSENKNTFTLYSFLFTMALYYGITYILSLVA